MGMDTHLTWVVLQFLVRKAAVVLGDHADGPGRYVAQRPRHETSWPALVEGSFWDSRILVPRCLGTSSWGLLFF